MTKKMAKADQDEMFSIIHAVRDSLREYAEARANAADSLAACVNELNEHREELHAILDRFASDAEGYFDERSDKWQESDAGSVYSDWKDDLRRLADELEEEIDPPELPELDEPNWVAEVADGEFVTFEG
jgi:hypothetical protein